MSADGEQGGVIQDRNSLTDFEQMRDAEAGCVPCKLCGGRAVITDAGTGAGYYIRCQNSVAMRDAKGCMLDQRRLGGWAYNVMDWWNRLHAAPATDTTQPPAETLAPCPMCGRFPKRNGRGGTGGVLCAGDNATVGMIHRFQTYGADQAEADAAWNTAALPRRAGGDAIPAGEDADEFATVEEWEHEDQRELSLLYNHKAHDRPQFNRGQMREAIRHGRSLATPKPPAVGDAGAVWEELRERCALAAYAACARTRHVTLGDQVAQAIRALALPAPVVEGE